MDRGCHERKIDESARRIRTGHQKQSLSIYPENEEKREGIQKHIWQKCFRGSLNNKTENNSPEKAVQTQMKYLDDVKAKKSIVPVSENNTKCEFFPATCTINLCPACRNLECNLKRGGQQITMNYDNPHCNLVTNQPSICGLSALENRSSNKSITGSDTRILDHSSKRSFPKISTSPQPSTNSFAKSHSLRNDHPIPACCPPSPSSLSSRIPSISSQQSSSPSRLPRFLIPPCPTRHRQGNHRTKSHRQPQAEPFPTAGSKSEPLPSPSGSRTPRRRSLRRNASESFRKPNLSARMPSASPRSKSDRGSGMYGDVVDIPAPPLPRRLRKRSSAPPCRFDRKPPLPNNPNSNNMAWPSPSSDRVSENHRNHWVRQDSCDDGSQDSYNNFNGVAQHSMNTNHLPFQPGAITSVNAEMGYSSDQSNPFEFRDSYNPVYPTTSDGMNPPQTPPTNAGPDNKDNLSYRIRGYSHGDKQQTRNSSYNDVPNASNPPYLNTPPKSILSPQYRSNKTQPYIPDIKPSPYIQNNSTQPYIQNNSTQPYIQNNNTQPFIQNNNTQPYTQNKSMGLPPMSSSYRRPCCSPRLSRPACCSPMITSIDIVKTMPPQGYGVIYTDLTTIFGDLIYLTQVVISLCFGFLVLCLLQDLDPVFQINIVVAATVVMYFIVMKPSVGIF